VVRHVRAMVIAEVMMTGRRSGGCLYAAIKQKARLEN